MTAQECVPAGWKYITDKAYSDNPSDAYLRVVIAYTERRLTGKAGFHKQFVTWLANLQAGGCGNGHYFDDLPSAVADYKSRGSADATVFYQSPPWR